MAEQSAFLTAYDEMQKKKREQEGFSAPAPMESVVDTVGQAPAVQSPFSQAAAPNPMEAAVDPMAQTDVLAAAPAVQAPPSLVTDNPFAPSVGVSEPTVPQDVQDATERARIEDRLARTNADIVASGETVGGAPQEGFVSRLAGRLGEQFTQPAPYTPLPGGAESETAFGATPTQPTLFREGLSAISELNKTPLTRPDSYRSKAPEATPAVEMATPESIANLSVNGTDIVTPKAITEAGQVAPAAVEPQTQLPSAIQSASGQDLIGFKPKYEGQSLADYMAGRDDPSAASVQVQDPQGRFRRQAASVAGETPEQNQARTDALFPEQADFQQASADREARQAARPDFGEAQERAAGTVTDAERRGNGAPTSLFKAEAEAAGLSGRAKSDFISEKTRLWSETKEDREIERASGQAAGERANIETQLKIKDWEKTNADERTERVDEMNTEISALTSIIGQAENISGVAQEAGRQVGAGTTGFFSPLKWIGGTTAADLAGNLETIKSDAFVSNITEMRQNSPTGGAVGNVSDKDLEMLQSLQTSFRQNLKPTTLRANLKKYQKIRAKVVADAKRGFVLKYGQENLNKYFGDQQQAAGKGSSAIPNDRNVTTSNNELYEKHSQ